MQAFRADVIYDYSSVYSPRKYSMLAPDQTKSGLRVQLQSAPKKNIKARGTATVIQTNSDSLETLAV